MNSRFQWVWGLLKSGYERGNMSVADIIAVEYQKKYNSCGLEELGVVSLKVVGFRLRIKDREELRLIRQMIADRISCVT